MKRERRANLSLDKTAVDGIKKLDEVLLSWRDDVAKCSPSFLEEYSDSPPDMIDEQFPFIDVILHTNQLIIQACGEVSVLREPYAGMKPGAVGASLNDEDVKRAEEALERARAEHAARGGSQKRTT